jgi:hypothetical protein
LDTLVDWLSRGQATRNNTVPHSRRELTAEERAGIFRAAGVVDPFTQEPMIMLITAAVDGDLETVQRMVAAGMFSVEYAMGIACQLGSVAMVDILVRAGADMPANSFHRAVHAGHGRIVERLLRAGFDVHYDGDWAIRFASGGGLAPPHNVGVVAALIEYGADVHSLNGAPLILAAQSGHTGVVRLLLGAGARVNASGGEALVVAARKGHLETVNVLVALGRPRRFYIRLAMEAAAANGHLLVKSRLRSLLKGGRG